MFNSEEQYFDTFSLEIHMVSTTYFDPIFMDAFGFLIDDSNDRYFDSMTTDDTIPFSNELDFSSLYTSRNRIYDIEDSKYDASCDNLLPTPHAYNSSLTETVNLYSTDLYTAVLIIFGSGTSLVISVYLSNFTGSITRFTETKQLGGMIGGAIIEGQGIVK